MSSRVSINLLIFLLCSKSMRILRSCLVVAGMQVVDEAIPCLPVMRSFASVFPTAFGALTTDGVKDRLEQDLQNPQKTGPYLATRNRSPKQPQILGAEFDQCREPDFRAASKQFSENSSACRPSTSSHAERRKVVAILKVPPKKPKTASLRLQVCKFALRKTLDNNSTTMPNSSTHHRHRSGPRRPNLSGVNMCQSGLLAASTCILTMRTSRDEWPAG